MSKRRERTEQDTYKKGKRKLPELDLYDLVWWKKKKGNEKKYETLVGPFEVVGEAGQTNLEVKDVVTGKRVIVDSADVKLVV